MSRAPTRSAVRRADLHRAWLELVDTDGPFLAVPALKRVWPHGHAAPRTRAELAALTDAKPAFEKAWDSWDTRPRRRERAGRVPRGAGRLGGRRPAGRPRLGGLLRRSGVGRRRRSTRPTTRSPSPPTARWLAGTADRGAGPRRRPGRLAAATR